MKKVLFIILLVVITGCLVFFILTTGQKQTRIQLEDTVEFLKEETVPIKFKITERTDSSLTTAIKFFDADGKEISKTGITLIGRELSFDFITIHAGDSYVSFPYKVFTDQIPPAKGEKLSLLYDRDGAPAVFVYKGMHKELLTHLEMLFREVKNDNVENLKDYFGNLVHDIEKIRSFKTGIVYKIVVHVKGGIEVMEE